MQGARLKLPGLLPNETAIYLAWWEDHFNDYTAADYNVRVGTGFDPGPAYDRATRDNAIKNTQLRVDALLFRGPLPVIVEVKERATPPVIGQLLAYKLLWWRDNPAAPEPAMMLLCSRISPDAAFVCARLGIAVTVVTTDLADVPAVKR